jgi:hypothetical protein
LNSLARLNQSSDKRRRQVIIPFKQAKVRSRKICFGIVNIIKRISQTANFSYSLTLPPAAPRDTRHMAESDYISILTTLCVSCFFHLHLSLLLMRSRARGKKIHMFEMMMTSERDKQRETFDFNSPSKLNFAFARQTFLRLPFLSLECVLSLFSRIVAMGYEYARTEIIHFFPSIFYLVLRECAWK